MPTALLNPFRPSSLDPFGGHSCNVGSEHHVRGRWAECVRRCVTGSAGEVSAWVRYGFCGLVAAPKTTSVRSVLTARELRMAST